MCFTTHSCSRERSSSGVSCSAISKKIAIKAVLNFHFFPPSSRRRPLSGRFICRNTPRRAFTCTRAAWKTDENRSAFSMAIRKLDFPTSTQQNPGDCWVLIPRSGGCLTWRTLGGVRLRFFVEELASVHEANIVYYRYWHRRKIICLVIFSNLTVLFQKNINS